ncbi:chaperonin 10-like protein, partial [Schizophyllum fasciatum]
MPSSKCIVLNERPPKDIDPQRTFREETRTVGEPGAGEVLVKTTWLSLDPAMRGWLNDKRSYLPPVQIGETMRSGGLAVVVKAGEGVKLAVGDSVQCSPGWAEYAILKADSCTKIELPTGAQPLDFLNTLGMPGMTAYF